MNIDRLKEFLGIEPSEPADRKDRKDGEEPHNVGLLHEEQQQQLEQDISILEDDDPAVEKKVQRAAERTVHDAAEESLRRLRVIQMGRCPECGAHLVRHLFASVCESCGWHEFEVPRRGPVRVHLKNRADPIAGDRAYLVKPGFLVVIKEEVVVARVSQSVVSWIEYVWSTEEIEQRHRQIVQDAKLPCGWCEKPCDPDKDGFHLVHVAFGSTQDRYTFCSDECYEAFRKMYPARVHRNCYERECRTCDLCVKRFDDEAEGMQVLAKDHLRPAGKAG